MRNAFFNGPGPISPLVGPPRFLRITIPARSCECDDEARDSSVVSIVHAARDIGRVRDISGVLARHGFGEVLGRMGFGPKRTEPADTETRERSWATRLRMAL